MTSSRHTRTKYEMRLEAHSASSNTPGDARHEPESRELPDKATRAGRTGQVTLREVARAAGVSTATVSRTINDPNSVSLATREWVNRIIKETNYVPNLLAGALASNRTKLIVILTPPIISPISNEIIVTMIKEFATAGFFAVMSLTSQDASEMSGIVDSILSRRPDGVVIAAAEVSAPARRRLKKSGVTVVETWDLPRRPLDVAIGFSQEAVGQAVAQLVIDKGYRAPLVISTENRRAMARLRGFVEWFRSNGLSEPAFEIVQTESGVWPGRESFARHLDRGRRPDVVYCSSDLVAQDILNEAAVRGMRVPADVGVVGFGGTQFAARTFPPLTTVQINAAGIAQEAARLLIGRANGTQPKSKRIDVGFSIISRETL
jgi:LacI family gluconate utilization system Gnt-I transcriptional repressor